MIESQKCPYCGGAGNLIGSSFCSKCGKTVVVCPNCGTFNATTVKFCVKCPTHLPSTPSSQGTATQSGAAETPYMQWEGFPFATLSKVSMKKWQWKAQILIAIGFSVVMVIMLAASIVNPSVSNDSTCLIAGYLVAVVIAVLIWHLTGRQQAKEEIRRRRGDI